MSGSLAVAVVGVGHLGRIHARIWSEMDGAELRCVADVDPERARTVATEVGGVPAVEPSDLPEGLDAVSVAVPTRFHAEVAIPLLEKGISVLVEKPLAATVEEADAILAAAERGGASLGVGHVERFQPGVRKVREMGLVPRFIECHRLAPFSFRSVDVGVVHDLMIHDLDLVLELIGSEVVEVDSAGGAILTGQEDVASVRLVFENGARANVTASRASLQPMRRFRLFSAEGYVSLDFTRNHALLVRKGSEWQSRRDELAQLAPHELASRPGFMTEGLLDVVELELQGMERPLQAELASFAEAVRAGREPEVTGLDGRRALALATRIVQEISGQGW